MYGSSGLQEELSALTNDSGKSFAPFVHELSTTQLRNFLSTHQPPSEADTHCSDDRSTTLAAVIATKCWTGTLRAPVHVGACVALLL